MSLPSRFRRASIQRKQVMIIMLITTVALLLVCAAFTAFELLSFRGATIRELSTLAQIIGNNTASALDFNDPAAASETLAALKADPQIVGARVYAADGKTFATYGATFANPVKPAGFGHAFHDGSLALWCPIASKGEVIGSICLVSDLSPLYKRLVLYAEIIAGVFLLTTGVALFLSRRLQRFVSDPILRLARAAAAVASGQDYSIRVPVQNPDEIGVLIDGFNEMLAQIQERDANLERRVAERTRDLEREIGERKLAQADLEKVHHQLVEASRKAGMAEVASSVLHNVGNVLNSINVSTTLVLDALAASKMKNVGRLAALFRSQNGHLSEFFATDPKSKHVPAYLDSLAAELEHEQKHLTGEMELTRKNVEHIKNIVAMQQSYARYAGVVEKISPVELVEDALRINDAALVRQKVQVVRDFSPDLPDVMIDKHKILQILVNLISNARHACEESGRDDPSVSLELRCADSRLRFVVMDNGVGIPPENLTRIFNHGFTTRENGHGFGLHSGALAAHEMGGSLTAESPGCGAGARFTLELPLHPPQR